VREREDIVRAGPRNSPPVVTELDGHVLCPFDDNHSDRREGGAISVLFGSNQRGTDLGGEDGERPLPWVGVFGSIRRRGRSVVSRGGGEKRAFWEIKLGVC